MKVFLTGATGSIGSGVLHSLLAAGHEVTCPVRDVSKASLLFPEQGDRIRFLALDPSLDGFTQYSQLAQGFPNIIHTGFAMSAADNDFEIQVINGLLTAAKATAASSIVNFVLTTGSYVTGENFELKGEDELDSANCLNWCLYRRGHEEIALAASGPNLNISIVRPNWVYGGSFVDVWFKACKQLNKILVPEGNGRCTYIHKEDLGDIYRLIIEKNARGIFAGSEGLGPNMEELIELAKSITGVTEVERVGDVMPHIQAYGFFIFGLKYSSLVDYKRGREVLGYSPKYNLQRDAQSTLKLT